MHAFGRSRFAAAVAVTVFTLLLTGTAAAEPEHPTHPLHHITPIDTDLNMSDNPNAIAHNIAGIGELSGFFGECDSPDQVIQQINDDGSVSCVPREVGDVSGSGSAEEVAVFVGEDTISSYSNLFFDTGDHYLGIGTSSPSYRLDVDGSARVSNLVGSGVVGASNLVSSYETGAAYDDRFLNRDGDTMEGDLNMSGGNITAFFAPECPAGRAVSQVYHNGSYQCIDIDAEAGSQTLEEVLETGDQAGDQDINMSGQAIHDIGWMTVQTPLADGNISDSITISADGTVNASAIEERIAGAQLEMTDGVLAVDLEALDAGSGLSGDLYDGTTERSWSVEAHDGITVDASGVAVDPDDGISVGDAGVRVIWSDAEGLDSDGLPINFTEADDLDDAGSLLDDVVGSGVLAPDAVTADGDHLHESIAGAYLDEVDGALDVDADGIREGTSPEDVELADLTPGEGLDGDVYNGTEPQTWLVAWGDADELTGDGSIATFANASDLDAAGEVYWQNASSLDTDGALAENVVGDFALVNDELLNVHALDISEPLLPGNISDGEGSGLDADTVSGLNVSEFDWHHMAIDESDVSVSDLGAADANLDMNDFRVRNVVSEADGDAVNRSFVLERVGDAEDNATQDLASVLEQGEDADDRNILNVGVLSVNTPLHPGNISDGDGLFDDDGSLAVQPHQGILVNTDGVSVDADEGITVGASGVGVDVGDGIRIADEDGSVTLDAADLDDLGNILSQAVGADELDDDAFGDGISGGAGNAVTVAAGTGLLQDSGGLSINESAVAQLGENEVVTADLWTFDNDVRIQGDLDIWGNVSNTEVEHLNINGSLLPPEGHDSEFDIGASDRQWNNAYFGGTLRAVTLIQDGETVLDESTDFSGDVEGVFDGLSLAENVVNDTVLDNTDQFTMAALTINNGILDMDGNNIALNGGYLSNDGSDSGIRVNDDGQVGVGTDEPTADMDVDGTMNVSNQGSQMEMRDNGDVVITLGG